MSGLNGNTQFVGFPGAAPIRNMGMQIFPTATTPTFSLNDGMNASFYNGVGVQPTSGVGSLVGSEQVAITLEALETGDIQFLNAYEGAFVMPCDLQGPGGIAQSRAVSIAGLSAANIRLAEDWRDINDAKMKADGSEASEMAKDYLEQGENYFLEGAPDAMYRTSRFAAVMRNEELKMFRCACLLGLSRMNWMGIIQANREVNQRLPQKVITTLLVGNTKTRNYWGCEAAAGQDLFLIIRKSKYGPYQILPWSTTDTAYPPMSLTTYTDCAGKLQSSRVLRIGRITHTLQFTESPEIQNLQRNAGLIDVYNNNMTDLSTGVSHMNILEVALYHNAMQVL